MSNIVNFIVTSGLETIQLADQVILRLISQSINDILSIFQKLLNLLNGTVISRCFVSTALVVSVILVYDYRH